MYDDKSSSVHRRKESYHESVTEGVIVAGSKNQRMKTKLLLHSGNAIYWRSEIKV